MRTIAPRVLLPGRLDVDTVLREARDLGRKQFRARALAKAIDGALLSKQRASGGVPPARDSSVEGGRVFSGYPQVGPGAVMDSLHVARSASASAMAPAALGGGPGPGTAIATTQRR